MKISHFLTSLLVTMMALSCAHDEVKPSSRHTLKPVIFISVDGMRPEFYLDSRFEAPTMKGLLKDGAYAESVVPVFPTLTYPNHTSLISGTYPNQHGVWSNTVFTWEGGASPAWIWEAKNIKVPTLHDKIRKAGGKTASVRWPVTVGATNIDYLVPEIFSMKGFYEGDNFDLTAKYTNPDLMKDIASATVQKRFDNESELDVWAAQASAYILKSRDPDFISIHLANVDHVEHGFGRDAAETVAAVKEVDKNIQTILNAVDVKNTCVVVSGDHGFIDVDKKININTLFVQKGWIKLDDKGEVKDWQVVAQTGGGQAAIYIKNKKLKSQVEKLLKKNSSAGYAMISKNKMNELNSYPEADLAIEGHPGFAISGSMKGDLVASSGSLKGQHGFLPEHPQIHTGLIMSAACGYPAGTTWHEVKTVEIAPMIAKVMGLPEAQQ